MVDCLFCDIIAGRQPSEVFLETPDFLVINNKYPQAPIHLLVLPKQHLEKEDAIKGKIDGFWDSVLNVCWLAIEKAGLDKTGYKLINNGAGYNHFSHEHIHILGGSPDLAKDA